MFPSFNEYNNALSRQGKPHVTYTQYQFLKSRNSHPVEAAVNAPDIMDDALSFTAGVLIGEALSGAFDLSSSSSDSSSDSFSGGGGDFGGGGSSGDW